MVRNSLSYSFSLDIMALLLFLMSPLFLRFIEASALPTLSMDKTFHVWHAELRDFVLIPLLSHVH